MMRTLQLELYKLRRRGVLVTLAAILGGELGFLWMGFSNDSSIQKLHGLGELGWGFLLTQALMLHSLFFPILISVLASRICDIEHKGNTWKLLVCSNQRLGSLWNAKFGLIFSLLALAQGAEFGLLLLHGTRIGLSGFPVRTYLATYGGCLLVNFTLLTLQMFLSMYFQNQLIALSAGMLGGFVGILSMLMPAPLRRLFPSGYYTELCPAGSGLDQAGNLQLFHLRQNWLPVLLLFALGVLLFLWAKLRLERREW